MSKFKLIILSLILLGCKSSQSNIYLNQINTNYPVVLKYSEKYDKFSKLKIPLKLEIYNNSFSVYSFASIRYEYNSNLNGITEDIYEEKNHKLKKIRNNQRKYIKSKEGKKYILYTSHRLDSSKKFQQKLKYYFELIKDKNIDTLNVGTLDEFKSKNKNLLKILTKNDSVFINTWRGKDIKMPVRW